MRNQFERLRSDVVNWRPYIHYVNNLPWAGIRDQGYFPCRMWCIHFWEVEIHLPERVFRQFGLYQAVPPPAPLPFSDLEEIRKYTRAAGLYADGHSADWNDHLQSYIDTPPQLLAQFSEDRQLIPYLPDRYN